MLDNRSTQRDGGTPINPARPREGVVRLWQGGCARQTMESPVHGLPSGSVRVGRVWKAKMTRGPGVDSILGVCTQVQVCPSVFHNKKPISKLFFLKFLDTVVYHAQPLGQVLKSTSGTPKATHSRPLKLMRGIPSSTSRTSTILTSKARAKAVSRVRLAMSYWTQNITTCSRSQMMTRMICWIWLLG